MANNEEKRTRYRREAAKKCTLSQIMNSKFVLASDDFSSHLEHEFFGKIFRVNIISTIIRKTEQGNISNLLVDDGTDSISLRFFETDEKIKNLEVGNVLLVIGKVREYNGERYLFPEIYKKCQAKWLKYRNLEIKNKLKNKTLSDIKKEVVVKRELGPNMGAKANNFSKQSNLPPTKKNIAEASKKGLSAQKEKGFEIRKEEKAKEVFENSKFNSDPNLDSNEDKSELEIKNPYNIILQTIKEKDLGPGILIEDLILKVKVDNVEKIIEKMIESGDIFQNTPGRVKVL